MPSASRMSPVPYQGYAIRRDDDGAVLACGQFARSRSRRPCTTSSPGDEQRGRSGRTARQRLLSLAARKARDWLSGGGDFGNTAARRIYTRLGFADGYAYHYRLAPGASES
ncbi:MAG: hypothetical protein U1F50_07495 [Rubrivivax sp.]